LDQPDSSEDVVRATVAAKSGNGNKKGLAGDPK